MARISYDQLPVEGSKFPRDTARILNQAMQGNQNCVFDFTVPAGNLDTPGETFRVDDIRISNQKFIKLEALNVAAELADVFITDIGNGFFELASLPEQFLFAQVQIIQADGNAGSLIGGVILPFDTTVLNTNWTVDLANNRIVSKIIGTVVASFTISGLYATGTDYSFGVRVFDNITDQNLLATLAANTSTANQNDVVNISGSVLVPLLVGNYVELFGSADTVNTFIFDAGLTLYTNTPNRGTPVLDELEFRCLVIG